MGGPCGGEGGLEVGAEEVGEPEVVGVREGGRRSEETGWGLPFKVGELKDVHAGDEGRHC